MDTDICLKREYVEFMLYLLQPSVGRYNINSIEATNLTVLRNELVIALQAKKEAKKDEGN